MTTNQLHRTPCQMNRHQTLQNHNLIFWSFVGTLVQSIIPVDEAGRSVKYTWFILTDRQDVGLKSMVWIYGVNILFVSLFKSLYDAYRRPEYLLICGWFVLAIIEAALFYNKAWFYVDLGFRKPLPMYSDTLIVLTFVASFIREWKLQNS